MAKDEDQIVVRLPSDLIERLDALAERMNDDPEARLLSGPRGVTRSAACRLALREGLSVLEKRRGKR